MRSLAAVLFLCCLLPGCGYRLAGTGKNLPPQARTVAIQAFQNDTGHNEAGSFVMASLREEFVQRTHLALVAESGQADLVLEGKISSFQVRPLSHLRDQSRYRNELRIVLDVRFLDLKNNLVLFEADDLAYTEIYEANSSDFFTQEIAILNKIARRFAKFAVASILESF